APEQAAGRKDLTTLADVYSLGAVLYEQLTGRPPFQAETPLGTVLLVLDREPAAPRSLNPHVGADLATICLKCLEKDSSRRYRSAGGLGGALGGFLAGEAIQGPPSTGPEAMLKWLKRPQAGAALWGLLLAASLAGGGGLVGNGPPTVLAMLRGAWFLIVL